MSASPEAASLESIASSIANLTAVVTNLDSRISGVVEHCERAVAASEVRLRQQMDTSESRILSMVEALSKRVEKVEVRDMPSGSSPRSEASAAPPPDKRHCGASRPSTHAPRQQQSFPKVSVISDSGDLQSEEHAVCVTGFKREILRETRERIFADVMKLLPGSVAEVAKFKGPYLAKFFLILLPSRSAYNITLDAIRAKGAYMWQDSLLQVEHELFFHRNKSVDERSAGRFQSHFYSAMKEALEETTAGMTNRKLRIIRGKLFLEFDGDALLLLSFSETMDSDRFKIQPVYGNCMRIDISREKVDSLVTAAAAIARGE